MLAAVVPNLPECTIDSLLYLPLHTHPHTKVVVVFNNDIYLPSNRQMVMVIQQSIEQKHMLPLGVFHTW